jgi:hypothetical protein
VYSPSTRFTIHLVDQLLHTTPKGNMRPLRNGSLGAGWVHGKRGPAEWPGPRGGNEAVLIPMYANNVAATTSISTVSQPPAFPGSCLAPPRAGVSGRSDGGSLSGRWSSAVSTAVTRPWTGLQWQAALTWT